MLHTSPPLSTDYDVAVIGGGIQGAGSAQAAAAAGYQVALIEKTTWAAGTSSKSSKLIHGGLRYIETGQFALVRESLQERELLLKLAPDLVTRQDFYIPVYQHSHISPLRLRLGLSLYSLLAGLGTHSHFQRLGDNEQTALNGLTTRHLQAVFKYSDAQTDDQLLTSAVVQSAKELGADLFCPAELTAAQQTHDGYQLQLSTTSGIHVIHCRYLINAAGPWVNNLCSRIAPNPPQIEIDLVQGTHLVLQPKLSTQCFYLEAPQDGRGVFVLPWYEKTLLGTTETLFHGNPAACTPLPHEQEYLLAVLKHYFPNWQAEVCDTFAGLRVLPRSTHRFFVRSREVQFIGNQHYLGIYGGKLTGYRATADKVVKRVQKALGKRSRIADTRKLPLKKTIENSFPQTNRHTTPHHIG